MGNVNLCKDNLYCHAGSDCKFPLKLISNYLICLYFFLWKQEQWGSTYEPLEALLRVFAFLWGTILFGFCIITGIQTALYLSDDDDDGRAKVSPVGQGRLVIVEYYKKHYPQLAVVLLLSEIVRKPKAFNRYFPKILTFSYKSCRLQTFIAASTTLKLRFLWKQMKF
jgi:hypothetical protein